MLMALGNYFFSWLTASYDNKEEARTYRWEAQNVVGHLPLYQYLGPGEQTLRLEGVIYSHYKGGILQIPLMKQTAAKGKPLMLVDGLGNVLGRWVITALTEKQTVFCSNGLPRKATFTLDLKQYDDRKGHVLGALFA